MQPPFQSLRSQVENLLRIEPKSKPQVYMQVYEASEVAGLNYWLELLFSAGIATLGLVLNSPAVVIGAMLISPLMGPILGAGLALAASDLYLGIRSLLNITLSFFGAIAFSAVLVWLTPFHSPTGEILARSNPNLLDLGVALFSGLAGSVVLCRGGGGGGVTALPGVAIAVALMPPLCAVGFGVGSGFSWPIISGAGLLFLTNLAAIIASAFLVFYIVRMDAPDVRTRIDYTILERISKDRLYATLQRTWLSRGLGNIGQMHWRIVMLAAVLAVLFVPLRRSLMQLRDETIARAAVREAIRNLAPADAVVSQQVDITSDRIVARLITTEPVPAQHVEDVERDLIRRTGKEANLSVRAVASDAELALLRERLATPPPAPAIPPRLYAIRGELMARMQAPLREIWPAEAAQLLDYELGFNPDELWLRLRYQSEQPFDPAAQEVITKLLRSRLGEESLRVVLEHVPRGDAQPTTIRAR